MYVNLFQNFATEISDGPFSFKTHLLRFICVLVDASGSSCLLQATQQRIALVDVFARSAISSV